nr:LOW QUALITY PROTEIN: proapoptotic nucleolar protein 1 [Loxodonta africana]
MEVRLRAWDWVPARHSISLVPSPREALSVLPAGGSRKGSPAARCPAGGQRSRVRAAGSTPRRLRPPVCWREARMEPRPAPLPPRLARQRRLQPRTCTRTSGGVPRSAPSATGGEHGLPHPRRPLVRASAALQAPPEPPGSGSCHLPGPRRSLAPPQPGRARRMGLPGRTHRALAPPRLPPRAEQLQYNQGSSLSRKAQHNRRPV